MVSQVVRRECYPFPLDPLDKKEKAHASSYLELSRAIANKLSDSLSYLHDCKVTTRCDRCDEALTPNARGSTARISTTEYVSKATSAPIASIRW
jgi:hypothetical protein